MSASLVERMLEEAVGYSRDTEDARQAMLSAAARRQEAIFGLHAEGLSVRRIAGAVGCSPKVVQDAIDKARRRRPHMDRRDLRVSWELHRAVADKLQQEPERVIAIARRNLSRMRARHRDEYSEGWLDEWQDLLDGAVTTLASRMLGVDDRAADLRQMTPFAGVLTPDERLTAIHKAVARAA